MGTATVTSKGQVTIPVEVRSRLGIRAGTRLAFVDNAEGGVEIRVEGGSVRDLKGAIDAPGPLVAIEDMDDAIAHSAAENS